ncbi:rRNA maturation RNase YbeY [Mucilaginibacter sp. BT774]|uniref:rRNA maturation RNase YbeY n=1 Tax=Mucilaginibacter sp. BT774 TaxID=3062276 RepID=UPI00267746C4|nr:rRNA maturation RNase YbeY [Mucilaginibacter sp. BT774]MDO3626764.1 rRNA maturation RNase YbeY [Mucilaginibacter sp. BT774]
MPSINFFEEDISFKLKNKTAVKQWVKAAIEAEGYKLKELNYIFCSDEYLLKINQQYLDHDTYTDIVTFDNSEKDGIIEGDIFISIDRIRENAIKFNSGEIHELHRVIIHGVLHLLGYQDKAAEKKKIMTAKEDHYLSQINFT